MTLPVDEQTNWNSLLEDHVLVGHNVNGTHKPAEITEHKILSFTRDMTASTGDVAYVDVGFTPRQVIFFAAVASNKAASWGDDDGTDQMCTYQVSTGDMASSIVASIILENSSSEGQIGKVKTLDSDGFTLTWTKNATPPAGTATIIAVCFK